VDELILHHYSASPFAEKIRAVLGLKSLAWRSVEIPVVMPKPDLTALSGGYRKTPVLQVGCDVYCDTSRIARLLDAVAPEPPVFRPEQTAVAVHAGRWLDHTLFFAVVGLLSDPAHMAGSMALLGGAEQAMAFSRDRAPMRAQARVFALPVPEARAQLAEVLADLETQLLAGGPYLLGASPGWLDLCAYHPLWLLDRHATLRAQLDATPSVRAWLVRVAAFGSGTAKRMRSEEALEVARSAAPRPLEGAPCDEPDAPSVGSLVDVAADDYGMEVTTGTLVHLTRDAIVLERTDPRAGDVRVHFPRHGFRLTAHA
jgi:glutathione S-transferase